MLAFAVSAPLAGANAQSSVCASLEQRFLSGNQAGGANGLSAERVARQLIEKQAEAQRHGCGGFSTGGSAGPKCPQILADVRGLRERLTQAQSASADRQANGPSTAVQLRLNGCRSPSELAAAPQRRQSTDVGGRSIRTLCVRVCDGYYFPVAAVTRRDRQKVYAEVCQSLYARPGQAEVFFHREGTDVGTAVAADGKNRYADQQYAFKFRERFNPVCQAQLAAGVGALASRYRDALIDIVRSAGTATAATVEMPLPRLRPKSVGEDPETLANISGGLEVKPLAVEAAARVTVPGVRFVGEPYYALIYDRNRAVGRPSYRPPLGFDLLGPTAAQSPEIQSAAVPTQ